MCNEGSLVNPTLNVLLFVGEHVDGDEGKEA